MKTKIKTLWAKYKSYIFLGIIILLALKVFLPELDSLKESLQAIKNAQLNWIIFGQIVFFLGLPIVAWQFLVIAIKPLKYWLTFKVQMASLFVSKLFPSSLGTVALNFYYFTKMKHDNVQSATVMAINGITSAVAYVFIIGFAVFFNKGSLETPTTPVTNINWALIIGILTAVIAAAILSLVIKKVRTKVISTTKEFTKTLVAYKHRKSNVLWAVFLNFAGSLTSLITLWASAHALGVDITMTQALVAYVLGNIVGGLVPTPGGIGAVEAGIYSGLFLIGVDSSQALVITMVYRFLTYWVPILPGYYFFWSLRKDVLKQFSLKKQNVAKMAQS